MNNNAIYNAVVAGAGGAFQQRWVTNASSGSYDDFTTGVAIIATAIDDDIPAGDITAAESALMQSITQGVFADRFPFSNANAENYAAVASAIVALFTSVRVILLTEEGGGGGGTLRVDWAFWSPQTFVPIDPPNVPAEVHAYDSPGMYNAVQPGDTILFPPLMTLVGGFHSGSEAPQLGGVYIVNTVTPENTSMNVSRDPRFSTTDQVNAIGLIVATAPTQSELGEGGAGTYQVRTPKDAVFGTDPQVIEMCAIPAPPIGIGDIYTLNASVKRLYWQVGSINSP